MLADNFDNLSINIDQLIEFLQDSDSGRMICFRSLRILESPYEVRAARSLRLARPSKFEQASIGNGHVRVAVTFHRN